MTDILVYGLVTYALISAYQVYRLSRIVSKLRRRIARIGKRIDEYDAEAWEEETRTPHWAEPLPTP